MPVTTTMNISLPETMKSFIEERLANDGYGTVSEYIRELIRADQRRREEMKLETLLLQRLQDENVKELNMAEVRAEAAKRVAERKSKK